MAVSWNTLIASGTLTTTFNADVMILLTDSSMFFSCRYVKNITAAM
jgi:hypothetical protein